MTHDPRHHGDRDLRDGPRRGVLVQFPFDEAALLRVKLARVEADNLVLRQDLTRMSGSLSRVITTFDAEAVNLPMGPAGRMSVPIERARSLLEKIGR